MANDGTAPLLTSSQESMVMETIGHLDLQAINSFPSFGHLLETEDVKFDITQHLLAPEQQQQQVPMLEYHLPPTQVLSSEEFAGALNFQVEPDQQGDTKSSWVYSQKLKKVFIEMGKTLPIRIKWSLQCPETAVHTGLYVKAQMVFCQSAHRSEPVTRCHNHIASSTNQGMLNVNHILSCKHASAVHNESNGHYSVVVPLAIPQPGSDSVQVDYAFNCKNSCTGVNRRATEIVFNLENDAGNVLGRRKLLVRICSCPKRDREKEERTLMRDTYPQSVAKKRKIAPGKKAGPVYREQPESEIFTFSARIYGRDNYEQLKRVALGLMLETYNRTGQQAIKPLLEELNNNMR